MKCVSRWMVGVSLSVCLILTSLSAAGCGSTEQSAVPEYSNPFTDPVVGGKEDTGYYNLTGVELHITLEADVEASTWRIFDAPAQLAQFAVTHLRNRETFYIELLAEAVDTPDRVEWLVDGEWLSKEQAELVDRSKLRRWRLRDVNAVVLDQAADSVVAGQVFEAPVPVRPYDVFAEADSNCADYNSHLPLSQSIYWYLWNPTKSACDLERQNMTVTVTEVLPKGFSTYPEYDRLWEDNQLTVAVFWAKLDDGDVADDYNWDNFNKFSDWLVEGAFTEVETDLGKRFTKQIGDKSILVDVYGPDVFHSVSDYTRLPNWQKAVSEHEVVLYNGHSVLGTGMAFEQITYPDFYQVFQVASCLSYEYYVRPILEGKGGWENVDVISNVEPTYYHENRPLVGAMLAKLFWGFEHDGQASWRDIMQAVSAKLGHSRFGVSGARDNCFSPEGNLCEVPECEEHLEESACTTAGCTWAECPAHLTCDLPNICLPSSTTTELRFESTTEVSIPDDDDNGVSTTLDITDTSTIGSLKIHLDITHSYVGDLEILLSHGDTSYTVRNREGNSTDDILGTFDVTAFDGQPLSGTWTLRVIDHANYDDGVLNTWALIATPAQ
jgi:Proprotein convertase P-domain